MDANNLKVWLPFNRMPTEDLCDNEWHGDNPVFTREITADGAINGNALQISYHGSTNNYLDYCLNMTGGITLGGQSFTIKGCFNLQSCYDQWNGNGYWGLFVLSNTTGRVNLDPVADSGTIVLAENLKNFTQIILA